MAAGSTSGTTPAYDHHVATPAPPTEDALDHLRSARPVAPRLETDRALARLQQTLFGVRVAPPAVGRYRIVRKLGAGASGVVYVAHDPELSRDVALKVLHATGGGVADERDRILLEAKSLARVSHPCIVEVYDVGTHGGPAGNVYLAMELVAGLDLHRWLQARPPWRDVVRVFVAAARGLAAAHAVGVVHRDFKPLNVIVGDDGRPRVVDFGLARTTERDETDPAEAAEADDAMLDSGSLPRGATLTDPAGRGVLGTPAYMAPEQHAGLPATAASDQYAWCVALWEGLFGRRPFDGSTAARLQAQKLAGPPRPPRRTEVPRSLARILRRGMDPDPRGRWPSMVALLAALQTAPQRPRRWREGLAIAAVAGVALVGIANAGDDDDPCTSAGERWARTWTDARRHQLHAREPASSARAVAEIEGFGAAWTAAHREVCRSATHHTPSASLSLDARMACLDDQLHRVDALLDVLGPAASSSDPPATAWLHLPTPSDCTAASAGPQTVPTDPALARAVARVRERIADADALALAGRYATALEAASEAAQRAESLAFDPLTAEALTTRGRIEQDVGRLVEAERSLTRAHDLAVSAGHDGQAARASSYLVYLVGHLQHRLDDALRWAQACDAEIKRSGDEHLRAGLLLQRAEAFEAAGRVAEAERDLDDALALVDADPIRQRRRAPTIHNNLGDLLQQAGRLDEARAQYELALDRWIALLGPDHPDVAIALTNLATLDLVEDAPSNAVARLTRAIEIRSRVLAAHHPLLISTRASLAVALREDGDLEAARAILLESAEILRAEPSPPAEELVAVYTALGTTARAAGDHEAARAWFEQSLATVEGTFLAGGRTHALVLVNRALTAVHLGDVATGTRVLDDAMAIEAQWLGADHPAIASRRFLLATALRDAGAESAAAAVGRQALQDLDEAAAPQLHAEIDAWLHGA